MKDIDFFHVKADRAEGVPAFALKDVQGFRVHASPALLPDTVLEEVAWGSY